MVLVEDNEDALESLRVMLELDGHNVVTARDGVSGLRTVLDLRPDVAVVDVGLPGMTGLELAKRSRGAGFAGLDDRGVRLWPRDKTCAQARASGLRCAPGEAGQRLRAATFDGVDRMSAPRLHGAAAGGSTPFENRA